MVSGKSRNAAEWLWGSAIRNMRFYLHGGGYPYASDFYQVALKGNKRKITIVVSCYLKNPGYKTFNYFSIFGKILGGHSLIIEID